MFRGAPLGQGEPLHGAEDPGFQTGVAALEFVDQFLDLLALGVAVGGAGVENHRQIQPLGGMADQDLAAIEQGPDLSDTGSVQKCDGLEAGQAALVE